MPSSEGKFTDVAVYLGDLSGPEGNAYSILGRVEQAMKEAGWSQESRDAYQTAATSGDYDNLLKVTDMTVHAFALIGGMARPLSEYIAREALDLTDEED